MHSGQSTRCTKKGKRWQCTRPADPGYKHCAECRNANKRSKKKRRIDRPSHCILCGKESFTRRVCFVCTAKKAEGRHPDMQHDVYEHVRMLKARHRKYSRCQASGISLLTLEKMGECLTVDRIDPRRGYARGNMQLLSRYLNTAKGVQQKVPRAAIKRLRRRVVRYSHDKLSASKL